MKKGVSLAGGEGLDLPEHDARRAAARKRSPPVARDGA